ncbi:hypothetical protein [Flavobacterium sp.]|uniref:hypothetical protein n=1 Tax=Flavobacterium sp. TaxID=239 RepID=UPI0011F4FCA7|nr:hypothetical protein [Flavobacterium sp.]RZJ73323.1 MAG: hypothetical protein EOO49_03160 [Flavobacterium sp.]
MKNVMKFGLVMAMLFGMAFSAFANTKDFSLRITKAAGKTVSFSLAEAKNVTLSIYGQNEGILFQETFMSDGHLSRTYDLNAFPVGNYTLETESATEVTRYEIAVDANSARIVDEVKAVVKKPMVVKKANERVTLSIINVEKTPVKIAIIDESGIEIYNETFPAELSLTKAFNFGNVVYGNYTFVTQYSNKTFTDSIKVGN